MSELKQSGRYELIDKKEYSWAQEMKMEAERDKERKEMAKKMKDEGIDIDTIQRITKLRKIDIKRL
jgi:hypothetical protein